VVTFRLPAGPNLYRFVGDISDIPAANRLAISPDGLTAYVGSGYGFIGVIDTRTRKVVAYVRMPANSP
jgi:hypothetical protein